MQVSQLLRISIVHKASPTPRPTPTPVVHIKMQVIATPRHVAVVTTPSPAPAAPKARAGLAKSIAHTIYHSPHVEHVAIAKHHAGGSGLGARGAGRGVVGTSGNGTGAGGVGNGTGTGGHGTGTGGYAAADEPCGFVEFVNIEDAHYDRSTGGFYQKIRMMVHYGDGHVAGTVLDWNWYWPSEAAFPWSDQNIHNQDFPVPFQFPPADKVAGEPPEVQYVIAHTSANGVSTILKDCKGM